MERNRRILVVDDQQDLREQLAKLLLRSGKKNETMSLVQQMRSKLLGETAEIFSDAAEGDDQSYVVDTAGQGEIAFEMVKKANEKDEPYALMFLDMRMPPGWDGLKTAKAIRDADRNIEIVIMTAYADHDQKQIADTVGTPEKLLYIKKPFQAEEIYQLALALTTKWSLELSEKQRRTWLEVLLRGMCKIKSPSIAESGSIYPQTLKALTDFTESKKGLLAVYDECEGGWNIEAVTDGDRNDAEEFVKKNTSYLHESRTTQHFEGKYILPLRKDGFFAVAVLQDVKTKNDPEWYKLLSLLVMTSTEVLSNAVFMTDYIEKERLSVLGVAMNKVSHQSKNMLNQILGYAAMIKDSADVRTADTVGMLLESGETMLRMLQNLSVYNNVDNMSIQDCDLIQIINSGCDNAVKLSSNVRKKISGPSELKIKASPELLQIVFANLASNSIEATEGNEAREINIAVRESDANAIIDFEDNGSGVPENIRKTLFNPFVTSSKNSSGIGLGLPIVRQILAKHKGGIIYDDSFKPGARFVITLQKNHD
jgi:signal transduction histidine kinase/DNA-binding response OmpR family regulator